MSLTPAQQFQELLKKSRTPLILLPAYPSRDAVATAFALAFALESLGQEPHVAGDNILKDKELLAFIGEPARLLPTITGARDFVLSFNTEHNKISNVRSETVGDELRIYLTPEHGSIDPRDFSFIPAQFKFDLAIVVGSSDKEHLGKVYESNPDIFYEMPVINIDNHPENELFGQINLVDITASSSAEILAEILEQSFPDRIDAKVGESLLSGIISATESFQKKNTTPKALQTASHLMDRGIDQQKIIRSLYKTQPLNLLKLWGRVMAGVRWNEQLKLIWALVSIEDLVQSRARVEDLPTILEKIRGNYSVASHYMILFPETPGTITGIVKSSTQEGLFQIATDIGGGEIQGDIFRFTKTAQSLDEAEQIIIAALQPKVQA
jgi:nanoRNase/pAp phosphatase (c-di-AMP/oligoRNAs hydrolase)